MNQTPKSQLIYNRSVLFSDFSQAVVFEKKNRDIERFMQSELIKMKAVKVEPEKKTRCKQTEED